MAQDRIRLFWTACGWMAEWSGPFGRRVAEMFGGVATLPTAFTAQARPETVLAEISQRNPCCTVVVDLDTWRAGEVRSHEAK